MILRRHYDSIRSPKFWLFVVASALIKVRFISSCRALLLKYTHTHQTDRQTMFLFQYRQHPSKPASALLLLTFLLLWYTACSGTTVVAFVLPSASSTTRGAGAASSVLSLLSSSSSSSFTTTHSSSSRRNSSSSNNNNSEEQQQDVVMDKLNAAWAQMSRGATAVVVNGSGGGDALTSTSTTSSAASPNINNNGFLQPRPPSTQPSPFVFLQSSSQSLEQLQQEQDDDEEGAVPIFSRRNRNNNNDDHKKVMEQYKKGVAGKSALVPRQPRKIPTTTRELQEQQLLDPVQLALAKQNRRKLSIWQQIASQQTVVVGALVGAWAVAPFLAVHHFALYPVYQSMAAWQYDTMTALIQGALYAATYRFAIREDIESNTQLHNAIQNTVLSAFVLVRSLVRVHVPLQCLAATPWLMCGEPLDFMNWEMIQEFGINFVESVALFGGVTVTMDFLLKRKWIFRFPG